MKKLERIRMILELTVDVQMAIKLRAVKTGKTTGEVVTEAVQSMYSQDVKDAKCALAEVKKVQP